MKLVAAVGAALCLALPALASAQQYGEQPTYAQPPQAPSYGNQEKITGTITSFDGQWIVYMHDDRGYTDHITLHQGTLINPTGIKLLEGMKVTIYGHADGPTFQANAINVAYSPYSQYYGANGEPAAGPDTGSYGYGNNYYPGGGYGYPGYGYGYGGYPYGIGIGIGINWGWGWGWGWPGYWGYPGYWWGGGYPYYGGYYGGGYYGGCCYGGYPYRYPRPPYRGGYPGTHGTVHGAPGGGTVRGGPAPTTGGGYHGGMSGGRPPHR